MKKFYLFAVMALTLFFSAGSLMAQDKPGKKTMTPEQRTEALVKFMEKRLMLDDKTAARFAPLYKEYLQALGECRMKPMKGELTDEQVMTNLRNCMKMEQERAKTREKYLDKFAEFLTPAQLRAVFCPHRGKQAPMCGRKHGNCPRFAGKPCKR